MPQPFDLTVADINVVTFPHPDEVVALVGKFVDDLGHIWLVDINSHDAVQDGNSCFGI